MEKTWNVSHRKMLSIPRTAHRYLLEPLSGRSHITKALKKRFLNFISKIKLSEKKVLRDMFFDVRSDCRSITGKNIRKLKLEEYINNRVLEKRPYQQIPGDAVWRVNLASEIIAIKSEDLVLSVLALDDLDSILENICCQ